MIQSLIRTHLQGFRAQRILGVGPGYSSFSRAATDVTGARAFTYLDVDAGVLALQKEHCATAGIDATTITLRLDATDLATCRRTESLSS